MTDSSSSSASCSHSSRASETGDTSILEAHHVDEVSAAVFDKTFYGFTVTDTWERPFELNHRVSAAVSGLGATADIVPSVCNVLNRIMHLYESFCCSQGTTRVKFVEHIHAPLLHRPGKDTTTRAKPQVIAVLEPIVSSYTRDFKAAKRRAGAVLPAMAWHHVLAGVLINDANDERQPVCQIVDFLGALNQAHPDLPGCFSLTATRTACRLWWSDAAGIYATPQLAWSDPATASRLLNFVYRLHHPLAVDSTISLEPATQRLAVYNQRPVWLVEDGLGGVYRARHVIAVGKPWTTKNWIAAATEHRSGDAHSFASCSRVIIKDSFPLTDNEPFAEAAILDHLHGSGIIPGICSPISSFIVANDGDHIWSIQVPDSEAVARRKHRLIMRGDGEDIYRCPSVLSFLMTMYDVLEVLRCAHEQRGVLHRDISLRNVLYSPSHAQQPYPGCKFAGEILAHRYPELSSRGPACVLIDFDNAVWEGHSPDDAERQCVGTPAFIARNPCVNYRLVASCIPSPMPELDGNAKECYVQAFGQQHYDDQSALLDAGHVTRGPAARGRAVHRPHHDAESCYWVTVHFLLTALPRGPSTDDDTKNAEKLIEMIEQNYFGILMDVRSNVADIGLGRWAKYLHPELRSLDGFLFALSDAVSPLFELFEPPLPPYHLHEAMQRIILQEACRLLDTDPLRLDTRTRRSFHSHFNTLPTALQPSSAASPFSSRKRTAKDLDEREGGGPRPRTSV